MDSSMVLDLTTCTPEAWILYENDWLKLLENENEWNKLPSLNVSELHNLKNSTLVRFRGMVQDMRSPEYYFEEVEVTNETTKAISKLSGKYRDIIHCKEEESIDLDKAVPTLTGERQTLVVITDPAENEWVKTPRQLLIEEAPGITLLKSTNTSIHTKISHIDTENFETKPSVDFCINKNQQKRPLDSEDDMEVENAINASSTSSVTNHHEDESRKKQRTEEGPSSQPNSDNLISKEYLLNFPLPDRVGKACHVKIYKDSSAIKVNDICEFVGFLSVDPQLAAVANDDNSENKMEIQTHHPPPSLIPRLHCVHFKKISHYNPLLKSEDIEREKMQSLRKDLMILLTQLMLGDELAAEYLICNLISEIYMRKDFLTLGNFTVNISNIPTFEHLDYVSNVYEFIEMLVTKSHYFPMTLENLNELTFIPKKDYQCERLTTGMLQLSTNSHLILDETKLNTGKLDAPGVNNVKVLANAIKNQKLSYDFGFYQLEFNCDISFLTFSEGKSMLPSDCHIILQPHMECVDTFSEIIAAAKHFLKPDLLNDIRKYITSCRMVEYEISDNVQQMVQNEFVNMRQKDAVSADDLHKLLVLSRLICISEGKATLDEECWKKACHLEENRKKRIVK